jgi:3-oxoacyl-(acyl-carrier-protein) synthase
MFVHSYRRLGVLADLTPTAYRQRPLEARRSGFMLSEAGAAVLLRRLPEGQAPRPGEIELVDTAVASEAYDMVRPSPDMAALHHVAGQLLQNRPLGMIHPHAPGTAEHDPTELAVYRKVLENPAQAEAERAGGQPASEASDSALPELYACKGALGHSLGSAGLSALVLACLCAQSGQRPPMPWLAQPMPEADPGWPIAADSSRCERDAAHAVFAAGFAGHTAGAVIQRHNSS